MAISQVCFEASKKAREKFFSPANTKGAGEYIDNMNVIKGIKYRVENDPNIPKIFTFDPNINNNFINYVNESNSYYTKFAAKADRNSKGFLNSIWCPFGSGMTAGIIEGNHREWIDLWTKEDRVFFRGDESHPDSHKFTIQRNNKCDFYTEGNYIFGFASLKDANSYISASYNLDEKKFLDEQILKFLGIPRRENHNGDAAKAPAIGSSVVLDPIAYLGKVVLELPDTTSGTYIDCVKETTIVKYNKEIINVALYSLKKARVKKIRINKDNESLIRVGEYAIGATQNEYKAVIRNVISEVTPEEELEKVFVRKRDSNSIDYERGLTVIKEESVLESQEWMNKNESTEMPAIVYIPVSADDFDDEEAIEDVMKITNDELNKLDSGLARDTDEMMATEHMDMIEIPEEEELDDLDVKEIEDLVVAGDEDLEDEDDTDYSDHIEETIDLPEECKLKV